MRVYFAYPNRGAEQEVQVINRLIDELGLHTFVWERSFVGIPEGAIYKASKEEMGKADIFIGIMGHRYGWIAPKDFFGQDTTDGEKSIFHEEFLWAEQRKIPMLLFFSPKHLVDKPDEARSEDMLETDEIVQAKLKELRHYLRGRHVGMEYHSLAELRELAGIGLMRTIYMQRFGDKTNRDMVFISHSTQDDAFVNQLADKLWKAGLYPWVDHLHIPIGARWDTMLECALRAADSLVLVVSPESKRSIVVEAEWTFMGELGKKIYPILLKDTAPFRLRIVQFTDFRSKPEEAFYSLLEALNAPERKINWDTE